MVPRPFPPPPHEGSGSETRERLLQNMCRYAGMYSMVVEFASSLFSEVGWSRRSTPHFDDSDAHDVEQASCVLDLSLH